MDITDLTFPIHAMIPREHFNKPIGVKKFRRISEAVVALESLVETNGIEILKETKCPVDKTLFENQIVLNKLKNNKTLDESLKQKLIHRLNTTILNEGVSTISTKHALLRIITESENVETAPEEKKPMLGRMYDTARSWINIAVEDAKKVVSTFVSEFGEFGVAFLSFIKSFGDIGFKAGWAMLKNRDFVGLVTSTGKWLMARLMSFLAVYSKLYSAVHTGFFANLANTTPINALRLWLQENVQEQLDALFHPNSSNPEIKNIIQTKYLKAAWDEALQDSDNPYPPETDVVGRERWIKRVWRQAGMNAMFDKEVMRLTLRDDGLGKTILKKTLFFSIGGLLAWVAYEAWMLMIFTGDFVADYNVQFMWDTLTGKFDIAEFFLGTKEGFECLFALIAGKMNVLSAINWFGADNAFHFKFAVVLTVIMMWADRFPEQWESIKNSKFGQAVITSYKEATEEIAGNAAKIVGAFKGNAKLEQLLDMFLVKRTTP